MAQARAKRKRRRAATAGKSSAPGIASPGRPGGPLIAPVVEAQEPPPVTVDVARERPLATACAVAAIGYVVLNFGSVVVAAQGKTIDAPRGSDRLELLQISQSGGAQVTAMFMRVIGVLLLVYVAWFINRATHERNPTLWRWTPVIGVVGLLVVAVTTVIGFYATRHAAHLFAASGPQTEGRAHHLLDIQSLLGPASIARFLGGVLSGIWLALIAWDCVRVGLLTRFLGVFGIGAGVTTAASIQVSSGLSAAFIGSLGIIAAGYWPGGGRPPAWDAGRAVTWDEVETGGPSSFERAGTGR